MSNLVNPVKIMLRACASQGRVLAMAFHLKFVLIFIVLLIAPPIARSQSEPTPDPLVQVLLKKGVLSEEEARSIATNASPAEQRDRLAALLRDKGIISSDEFNTVRTDANAAAPGPSMMNAGYKPEPSTKVAALPQPSP